MQNDVLARVAALPRMPMPELSALWKELFQVEAPKYNKTHLIKRIAYRLQEIAYNVDSGLIDKRLLSSSSSRCSRCSRACASPSVVKLNSVMISVMRAWLRR